MKTKNSQGYILDPGRNMTLRPMRYPHFYEMFQAAIKNTWTVEEVDFSQDLIDLNKMSKAERHLISRLVAFFATGDNIVGENLVLNIYKHLNSPEGRMYLGRQIYEESLHVQFYLTLLDNYVTDLKEKEDAFAAFENIPSIKKKAQFSFEWIDSINTIEKIESDEQRKQFLKNMIAFAAFNEGLFFFGAFAYVYFLRSKGLLKGLGDGTNWVFRDESLHITFAFSVVDAIRREYPRLFDKKLSQDITKMAQEAVACEVAFAKDVLSGGVTGLSLRDMENYLKYVGDQRLVTLGVGPIYNAKNPFSFMEHQDVQELTNFFERRVSAYQIGVKGEISFDKDF